MRTAILALLVLFGSDLKEEVEAERAARDRELRSPQHASPLTAIDQTMVEPAGWATLSQCPDRVGFSNLPGCRALVEIRFEGGRFLAKPLAGVSGTWGPDTPFNREMSVPPGPADLRGRLLLTEPEAARGLALFFSLQGTLGRIMLHDTGADSLASFEGLDYYPVDARYHFIVKIEPVPEQQTIEMATTQGLVKEFKRLGTVGFEVPEGERRLAVFAPLDSPRDYFIPFRDTTNGRETYPMGRYLYLRQAPAPMTFILDFNRAFNPYCAYSAHYNCPYPPTENRLDIPIPAGEKQFKKQSP